MYKSRMLPSILSEPPFIPFYFQRYPTSSFALKMYRNVHTVLSSNAFDTENSRNGTPSETLLKVLFAAGGTGGHVYPAIAIANEIKHLNPSSEILFVGSKDRMESIAVPSAGFRFLSIPTVRIQRPIFRPINLLLPILLAQSLIACCKLILNERPDIVVGTGGYVSAPTCLAAAFLGCYVVIQEQNAYAGLANRVISRFARTIFVAFSAAVKFFPKKKCVIVGNPTRSELTHPISKSEAISHFFESSIEITYPITSTISSETSEKHQADERTNENSVSDSLLSSKLAPKMVGNDQGQVNSSYFEPFSVDKSESLVILGGSLGAKSINDAVFDGVIQWIDSKPTRLVLWQTGSRYFDSIKSRLPSHPRLTVLPFIQNMNAAYSFADLIIARSGAITCSELLTTGKPSILIPSPNVAEDHQTKNAMALTQIGAAVVFNEHHLSSPTPSPSSPSSPLFDLVNNLMGNKTELEEMSKKANQFSSPNASSIIAKSIIELVKYNSIKIKNV